jgi:hypothetical protein
MGKREVEKKPRRAADFYGTIDPNSIPHSFVDMIRGKTYAEVCYGDGDLEDQLMDVATCKWRSDIRETVGCSQVKDAVDITKQDLEGIDTIITNPPYEWSMLQPMLDHLPKLKPTWLLLPADMMHNVRMGPYMASCAWVLSIGRLYWMENKIRGVDNFCWYRFHDTWDSGTRFVGR